MKSKTSETRRPRNEPKLPSVSTEAFEALLDEFATAFVRVSALDVDSEIQRWLQRIVEFFDADRCSVGQFNGNGLFVTHGWVRPGYEHLTVGMGVRELPYLAKRLAAGEIVVIRRFDDWPPDAAAEKVLWQRLRLKSHLSVPIQIGGQVLCALAIGFIREEREIPNEIVHRLRMVTTVIGGALERRRLVAEYLQAHDALAHAGRVAAMGLLASSFAHEINQPLSANVTNAEVALRLLATDPPDIDEVRAALTDIVEDSNRAGEIVHGLRRYLRNQAANVVPLDVEEFVSATVRFVGPQARNKHVHVELAMPPGLPRVAADRVQIQQILVNLLLNALDALAGEPPERRGIVITASHVPSARVAIAVADNGPGIPEDFRERMFEPFVTSKADGLGLGLFVARTIAIAHRGELSFSPNTGRGAVFTFTLPILGVAKDAS